MAKLERCLPHYWRNLRHPKIFLYHELEDLFPEFNRFENILNLQGELVRDMPNRRTLYFKHHNKEYYAKLHFGIGWREIFKDLFQARLPVLGARQEFLAIHRMHTLGIDTMDVLGFAERYLNPARRQSFLITRAISPAKSLVEVTANWKKEAPCYLFKMYLTLEIARIARTLHTNGINHRDFYLIHFLWNGENKAATGQLFLIDLHRMQIRLKTPKRWKIKDLGALHYSTMHLPLTMKDYLRFVRAYRQKPLREILQEEKRFWARVTKKGHYLSQHVRG